jgi:hypothetical protein
VLIEKLPESEKENGKKNHKRFYRLAMAFQWFGMIIFSDRAFLSETIIIPLKFVKPSGTIVTFWEHARSATRLPSLH